MLYEMKIIGAIVIVIVGFWLAKVITKILTNKNFDPTLSKFITSIAKILLQIVVVLAALNTLNFQTTSLVAIIGADGLAIGFALQGSLSNFASGVMLIIFRPIKVHDLITAAGETGFVEEIGVFTTTLKMADKKTAIIPNSKLTGDNSVNFTVRPWANFADYWGVYFSVTESVKKKFDEQKISIPFPQRDIHMFQNS